VAVRKPKPGTGDDAAAASMEAVLSDGAVAELVGTRVMVTLTPAAIKLLDTAVLVDGMDRSAIVEGLVRAHLSGYHAGKTVAAEG
jgi:hypothetical protein